jgi:hypothetical protein
MKEIIRKVPILNSIYSNLSLYFSYLKNREVLVTNNELVNQYSGKRCFIIGNGPSISKMDIFKLQNEYTISVNSMTISKEFEIIKPKFHVLVDSTRFDKNIVPMYENMQNFKNLSHKPRYVFPIKFRNYILENKFDDGLEITYVMANNNFENIKDIDISKTIPPYQNVLNAALSFAISLGFSEIFLIGFEMTGFIKTYNENDSFDVGGHFYESNNTKESEYIKNLQTARSNEFLLSAYAKVFKLLKLQNDYAKSKGIKVYNATIGGTLDMFERVNFNNIINEETK